MMYILTNPIQLTQCSGATIAIHSTLLKHGELDPETISKITGYRPRTVAWALLILHHNQMITKRMNPKDGRRFLYRIGEKNDS